MRKLQKLGLLLTALLILGGCSGVSAEELYRLPEATEDYYDLQAALNDVLAQGYSYLAPASGARQEPVQLTDLNGDGVDEAVAFFRSAADSAVQVYIFSKENEVYIPAATIDGAGTAVAAVEYADLDGQGDLEIILTCQVSETVTQALQVYRYENGGAVNMLTESCSQYVLSDLDGDRLQELFCITGNGAEASATVEYYDSVDYELRRSEELRLSFSYDSLRRVQQGTLDGGAKGMLVSGVSSEGVLVTNVFTAEEGSLRQISPREDALRSAPVDGIYVYPTDIDGDGITEVAQAEQLPAGVVDGKSYLAVRWYGISGSGECEDKMLTYQKYDENWYFRFPEYWDGVVTVRETGGSTAVDAVSFYRILDGENAAAELDVEDEAMAERILTIYSLRGADRQSYAERNEMAILYRDSDVIYAADLNEQAHAWEGTITLAQVSEMFHVLRSGTDRENIVGTD